MHGGDGEVGLPHLLCQPFNFPLRVAEDDSLCDGESVIEVAQSVELPLLFLDGHEELLDTLQGQLITEGWKLETASKSRYGTSQ